MGALETDSPVADEGRCSGISASTDRVAVVRDGEGTFGACNGVLPLLVGLVGSLRWGEVCSILVDDLMRPTWASSKITAYFCEKHWLALK